MKETKESNAGRKTLYTKELGEEIAGYIATGQHTIKQICKAVNIGKTTYFDWKNKIPEFSNLLKEAEKARRQEHVLMAKSGLAKLLDTYEYVEESVVTGLVERIEEFPDGRRVITKVPAELSKKLTKKTHLPNQRAIEFVLINEEPENYQLRQHVDVTSKGEQVFDTRGMSIEELKERARLAKKIEDASKKD